MTIWLLGLIELHYLNQKWRHLSDDVWNFIQFWKKKKFGHLALLFLWRSFFSYGSKYLRNLFHHDDSWPKILLLTVFEGYCCTQWWWFMDWSLLFHFSLTFIFVFLQNVVGLSKMLSKWAKWPCRSLHPKLTWAPCKIHFPSYILLNE